MNLLKQTQYQFISVNGLFCFFKFFVTAVFPSPTVPTHMPLLTAVVTHTFKFFIFVVIFIFLPQRLPLVENLLVGKVPDGALLRETASMVADMVRSRSRQDYRREVLVNFVERGMAAALADAGVAVQREQKEFAHD